MRKFLKKAWSNEFIQGGFLLTSSTFLINVLNYFFNFLAGRALGPAGYGELTALVSYGFIFSIPIVITTTLITQKLSHVKDKQLYAKSLEIFLIEKARRWWILTIPAFLLIPFVPRLTNLSQFAGYSVIPFFFLGLVGALYGASLQGLRLFSYLAWISAIAVVIKFMGAILAFFKIGGLDIILFFLFLSVVFTVYKSRSVFKSYLGKSVKIIPRIERRLIQIMSHRQFVLTSALIFALTLLNNADVIFVKKFFPAETAGIYGSWSLFGKIIFYVFGPILSISFVYFSGQDDKKNHNKTLIISLLTLVLITFLSWFFYSFFGQIFINLLFGKKFNAVIPYLGSAALFGSLYTAISFTNGYFLAKKSYLTLILPSLLPLYFFALLTIDKQIDTIIKLNVLFSFFIMLIYLCVLLKEMLQINSSKLVKPSSLE